MRTRRLFPAALLAVILIYSFSARAADPIQFSPADSYAISTGAYRMTSGDFNKDGYADLAVAQDNTSYSILMNNGSGGFTSSSYTIAGSQLKDAVVVQLAGDTIQDLMLSDRTGAIRVLTGVGNGTFSLTASLAASGAEGIAAGDFNGDGYPDVAVCLFTTSKVAVLLGTSGGSFGTATTYNTGVCDDLAVGLVNADGNQDLVTANWTSDNISVLLGNGDGTFATATNIPCGNDNTDVALADINHDGKLDAVVASYANKTALIMLGNGAGGFTLSQALSVVTGPQQVRVADFNFDGFLDIVTANPSAAPGMALLQATGHNTFMAAATFHSDQKANGLAIADFNHDIGPDVATSHPTNSTVRILKVIPTLDTDGDGMPDNWENLHACLNPLVGDSTLDADSDGLRNIQEFTHQSDPCLTDTDGDGLNDGAEVNTYLTDPTKADTDGDGMPDGYEVLHACLNPAVNDAYADPDGDLWTNLWEYNSANDPCVFTDSDSDGMPDGWENTFVSCGLNPYIDDAALDPDADTLTNLQEYLASTNPCIVNDADGDGMPDHYEVLHACLNPAVNDAGADPDSDHWTNLYEYQHASDPCVFNDTDGDGMPDGWEIEYACVNRLVNDAGQDFNGNGVTNLAEYQAGTNPCAIVFSPADSYPISTGAYRMTSGDFNQDGWTDLAVAQDNTSYSILMNNGSGGFTSSSYTIAGSQLKDAVVVQLAGDTIPDLMLSDRTGAIRVLTGVGNGTFSLTASLAASGAEGIATGDFNGDGYPDVAVCLFTTSKVAVLLGTSGGGFGTATTYNTGVCDDLAVGLVNADGYQDLVTANWTSDNISVLLGNGDGTFATATNIPCGNDNTDVTLADVNHDGLLDAVVASYANKTALIMLGNGAGGFALSQALSVVTGPQQIRVADFNADGFLDIATANASAAPGMALLQATGYNTFMAAATFHPDQSAQGLVIADFNHDTGPDIATSHGNNTVRVMKMILTSDTDGDGMLTSWENLYACLNPLVGDSTPDSDGDGLRNIQEYHLDTNPCVADTDGDGLSDGDEVKIYLTDPLNPDTDSDSSLDGVEVSGGADPLSGRITPVLAKLGPELRVSRALGASLWPQLCFTGSEYGLAWEDARDGYSELYFTRLTAAGATAGGELRITRTADPSSWPALAFSGSEFGVSWHEFQGLNNHDLYFERISLSGATIGAELRVTDLGPETGDGSLVFTGSEFVLGWKDNRVGGVEEIYFTRISPAAVPIGPQLRVTYADLPSSAPSLAWTGSEFGVAWSDFREVDYEIYFARLSAAGTKIGSDLRVTWAGQDSALPALAWTGSEFGLSWDDTRGGNYEVYFTRIGSNGTKIGADLRVTAAGGGSRRTSLAFTGSEYGLAWEDERDGNWEIYFTLLSAAGARLFPDLRVTRNASQSSQASLVWTGSEFGLSWTDARNGNDEIYFARIGLDRDGDGLFTPGEIAAGTGPIDWDTDDDLMPDGWEAEHSACGGLDPLLADALADGDGDGLEDLAEYQLQTDPCDPDSDGDILSDGAEYYLYLTDPLNFDTDADGLSDGAEQMVYQTDPLDPDTDNDGALDGVEVYLGSNPLDPQSTPAHTSIAAPLRITCNNLSNHAPKLVWAGSEYGLSWYANNGAGSYGIMFDRISVEGEQVFPMRQVVSRNILTHLPSLVWTGSEYGINWNVQDQGIDFVRLDASGNKVGPETRITDIASSYDPMRSALAFTGSEFNLAWDYNWSFSDSDVHNMRISAAGVPLGSNLIFHSNKNTYQPSLAWTGSELGLTFHGNSAGFYQIYFTRVSTAGYNIGPTLRISGNGTAYCASLVWSGSEYGLGWYDDRSGNAEIYFARLSPDGTKIGSDLRVTSDAATSVNPTLSLGPGGYGVSWEDNRTGNAEIYFALISWTGMKMGPDLRMTSNASASVGPQLAWSGSEFGLSWQDNPTGTNDVYFVRFGVDRDGDGLFEADEIAAGTDPAYWDTDHDLMPDGWEARFSCLDPLAGDSALDGDNDLVSNLAEYRAGTNPCLVLDSDLDGMPDAWEDLYPCLDAHVADGGEDPDLDDLTNRSEYQLGLDPCLINWLDTDGDGMPDGWEDRYACVDALTGDSILDPDHDGLDNLTEYQDRTNPCVNGDADRDGLPDTWEIAHACMEPAIADELADYDGDGLDNFTEYLTDTDPCVLNDTDADGVPDGWEDRRPCLDRLVADSGLDPDGDGMSSLLEFQTSTELDPCDPDSEGDMLPDGWEHQAAGCGLDPLASEMEPGVIGPGSTVVSDTPDGEEPALAWTGSEFGVVWDDFRDAKEQLYFARVNAAGAKIGADAWVTDNGGFNDSPSLVWTGSEFGMTSVNWGSGSTLIYFSRLSAAGAKIGADTSIAGYNGGRPPSLAWTGSEFGVSWRDARDTNNEIYFARVSAAGVKIGSDVRITRDWRDSGDPALAWSGSQFGLAWTESRDSNHEVYFTRVSAAGAKIGTDIRVTNNPAASGNADLAWSGSEFGLGWQDDRDGNQEIYFTRLSAMGTKIGGDLRLTSAAGTSEFPSLAWTGSEFGVDWDDDRRVSGTQEIYFARVSAAGVKIGSDLMVDRIGLGNYGPDLAWSGSEFAAAWTSYGEVDYRIGFARISAAAGFYTDRDGDGLREDTEYAAGTDPCLADTDGDGLSDGAEVLTWLTDPTNPDTDGDASPDGIDCGPLDPNNHVSCAACRDLDDDGWLAGCDAYLTIAGPDCNDANPNAWDACATCRDDDADTWFGLCNAYAGINGPDCDDADPNAWNTCATCHDNDADTWFQLCNAYAGINGPDCNDANPNAWDTCATCHDDDADTWLERCNAYAGINGPDCDDNPGTGGSCHDACLTFYQDADSDAHGNPAAAISRCAPPAGYVADNTDCNDAKTNAWTKCATCVDLDADTWYQDCDRYLTINGPDCDDNAASGASCHNTCSTFYQDGDADSHGNSSVSVSGCSGPAGYLGDNTDCDDTNPYAWDTCATCNDTDADTYYEWCNRYSLGGVGAVTVGTGTGSWGHPLYTIYPDDRTQVIYLASEIGQPGIITAVALDVTTIPGLVMQNFTIRMKLTALSSYAINAWEGPGSGWVTVYQANAPRGTTGWRTFVLATPFVYNGTSNLMVDFSFNNSTWSNSGGSRATNTGVTRSLDYSSDNAYGDPLGWTGTANPAPYGSTSIPNLRFTFAPTGLNGPDCDDTNPNVWDKCATCVDADADAWYLDCDRYLTVNGPDCSDTNPNVWSMCATCLDSDADSWYAGCDRYQTINGPDCNNSNAAVYPSAAEMCDDIDNQCPGDLGYGLVDEGCEWDADGDHLPDAYETAHATSTPPLDRNNALDGTADFDGDGNSNANEYWNGSDPWTIDPTPGRYENPGCYYWADGDGDGNPAPSDRVMMKLEIAGVGQEYREILPHGTDTLDLDRDGHVAPSDEVMLRLMIAGSEQPGGYPSQALALEAVDAPTGSVAVGSTTHVTVSVHSVSGNPAFAPGFGVVFEVVSGNAVLLGGDGTANGEAAGNRYDFSMEAAFGAKANMVVLVTGSGPITIGAKIPECGLEPNGRWNDEVLLNSPVVINP
jgi:hypothetical protein